MFNKQREKGGANKLATHQTSRSNKNLRGSLDSFFNTKNDVTTTINDSVVISGKGENSPKFKISECKDKKLSKITQ
jgi:hypothetical protein